MSRPEVLLAWSRRQGLLGAAMTGLLIGLAETQVLAKPLVPPLAEELGGTLELSDKQYSDFVAQNTNSEPEVAPLATEILPSTQMKGFYFTGGIGANWPGDVIGTDVTTPAANYSFTEHHLGGFSAETGLGYDFGSIRAEITYAYDSSNVMGYTDPTGEFAYSQVGSVNKNSVFASAYWDVNTSSRFVPYIGAGIGYSNLSVSQTAENINGFQIDYSPYSVGAFAYQFKAGLSYLLSKGSEIFGEGIYRGMTGYSATDQGTTYNYNNYNSWGFLIGARIRLGI